MSSSVRPHGLDHGSPSMRRELKGKKVEKILRSVFAA
jgi:hypothetical protein